jgi:hypothetical protein
MSDNNKRQFINFLAGAGTPALVNETEDPLADMVHPLSYSVDVKKYPDMVAVPMAYKQNREFYELFKTLRTVPK